LKGIALKKWVTIMSELSCRKLNLLTVLSAACMLAACATTNTGSEDGTASQTETTAQVEPETEPVEAIETQEAEAQTLQIEPQTQFDSTPTPLEAEVASESVSDDAVQDEVVEEPAVFPEQSYGIEEPLEFESDSDSDSDAEIDRLREELAASEAELERSKAREAEAERSRALEAELERSRALEAELERSLAIEADAEHSRALEAEQVRSRELEAELERSRAQQAEAERNRALEAELERSRAQEAEAERNRALEAERERSRARQAEADAEYERSLGTGSDTEFGSELSDSDEMDTASDEQYSGMPDPVAIAQASDDDFEADAAEARSYPPGKPVEYSIYFAFNEASLDIAVEAVLMKHAEYLKANPELNVEIQGNCDERGSREYNIALGSRRALTVKRALELLGVDGQRIETVSFGAEKPIAFGHDEASWRLNRRADIVY
jgi:peptidoglycan-associated lipoprotein